MVWSQAYCVLPMTAGISYDCKVFFSCLGQSTYVLTSEKLRRNPPVLFTGIFRGGMQFLILVTLILSFSGTCLTLHRWCSYNFSTTTLAAVTQGAETALSMHAVNVNSSVFEHDARRVRFILAKRILPLPFNRVNVETEQIPLVVQMFRGAPVDAAERPGAAGAEQRLNHALRKKKKKKVCDIYAGRKITTESHLCPTSSQTGLI